MYLFYTQGLKKTLGRCGVSLLFRCLNGLGLTGVLVATHNHGNGGVEATETEDVYPLVPIDVVAQALGAAPSRKGDTAVGQEALVWWLWKRGMDE